MKKDYLGVFLLHTTQQIIVQMREVWGSKVQVDLGQAKKDKINKSRPRLDRSQHDKDKTRHDTTRHDTTRQNKRQQDKTRQGMSRWCEIVVAREKE
jgi:hypothetical protein